MTLDSGFREHKLDWVQMAPNAVANNRARRQPLIKIREGPLYRNMMNDKEFLKDVKDAVHKYAARVYREDSEFVGGFAKWRGHQGEGEGQGDDFSRAWREGGDVAYAYLCLEVFSMCEMKKYSFDSAMYHVEEYVHSHLPGNAWPWFLRAILCSAGSRIP